MTRTFQQVQSDIQAWDAREKLLIVQQLIEELDLPPDPDVEAAWAEEIRRRLFDLRSGKGATVPANVAIAEIRASLKR